LPLCGYPYLNVPVRSCRRCRREDENGYHVLNHCNSHLTLATQRHDSVLELLDILLTRRGYAVTINKAIPGQRLRPGMSSFKFLALD
jgi:hypothetical protein